MSPDIKFPDLYLLENRTIQNTVKDQECRYGLHTLATQPGSDQQLHKGRQQAEPSSSAVPLHLC